MIEYEKGLVNEVKLFCVNNLAGILFRHVEHSANPRDKIDWFTAQDFVSSTFTLRDARIVTYDFLQLCAYDKLQKSNPRLPSIKRSDGSCWATDPRGYIIAENDHVELNRISEELNNISNKEYDKLISINDEEKKVYKQLFLGRFVWDHFYQPLQRSSLLSQRGYGKVRFY